MKFFFVSFCFFLTQFGFSQGKLVSITWGSDNDLTVAESQIYINGASGFFNDDNGTSNLFTTSWKSHSVSYVGAKATAVTYEAVSSSLYRDFDVSSISNGFSVTVEGKNARDSSFEVLSFSPLFLIDGKVQRVISFNLQKSPTRRSARDANVPSRSSSVLANGAWYRFAIGESGVYKITPQFLSSIGVNLNGVAPQTIKIYGSGGKALPLRNDSNRFYDVPQVPVQLVDNGDGVFSNNDYLLFYAEGSRGYQFQNDSTINPYSDVTYYYVTTGGDSQLSVISLEEPAGNAEVTFDSFNFETFLEIDKVNIGSLGRKWFGDELSAETPSRNYTFTLPFVVQGSNINITFPFAGVFQVPPTIETRITSGEQFEQSGDFRAYNSRSFAYELFASNSATVTAGADLLNIEFTLNRKGDPSTVVYLDYIRVIAECQLIGRGKQFVFSNENQAFSSGISQFQISNAANVSAVWDITDPYNIAIKENLNRDNLFTLKSNSGATRSYLAIDENDFFTPRAVNNARVSNQDLKGNIFRSTTNSNLQGEVDYLIITKQEFLGAANKLADFRRQQDGFDVKIVTLQQIYNEFSTGIQDITAIRNFVKYVYDNPNDPARRLQYLCLIGDTSYDYKGRISSNDFMVPSYFALNSRSLSNSYVSDDFFGVMDANEGLNIAGDLLDIAVGRIVAPTPEVANQLVDKTIRYYEQQSYGTWRNQFLFVCDDVDQSNNGIDSTLSTVLDQVAEDMRQKLPNANINKLFADAFKQEVTSAGNRYPVVNAQLKSAFEAGASYINYFGHGGEDGISSEALFRAVDAQNLTNRNRLTVFTTLTCELTRFDNPLRDTAGEFMFWNPNGGAVALLTTTRNLNFTTALGLNPVLANALFDDQQNALPIGKAVMNAKNDLVSFRDNRLAVTCVGDPALKIVFPKPKVELTKVNGVEISEFNESLRALDKVIIEGKVVDNNTNQTLVGFQGKVGVVIFDKIEDRSTLANDGTVTCWTIDDSDGFVRIRTCSERELFILDFKQSGNAIFNGQATVKDGLFSIEFIVSKNIRLPLGEGKISFYAEEFNKLVDQSGNANISIGGLNQNAEEDVTPPLINLFLNNENFVDGQLVNNAPLLIAKLNDANGINTAGGVGHDILAIIDNDELNPINLNAFYTTDLDDFTNGSINFRLNGLTEGEHTLQLRVSDVFNNVATQEISFTIGAADQFEISEVLNYPNPFTSYTEFWFTHSGSPVDVLETTVQVMTVTGKVVATKFATLSGNTNTYRGQISWDGKDDFGNKLGKGVYIYKIIVKSTLTNKTYTKLEKLVLL